MPRHTERGKLPEEPRLAGTAKAWEERARGAEAELAATRWELTVSREASLALLELLADERRRPLARLAQTLRIPRAR